MIPRTLRGLLGLAAFALVPSLACDTDLDLQTRRAFGAAGLEVRETHLVPAADGTPIDRRHTAFRDEAKTRRDGAGQRVQVVRPAEFAPVVREASEVVLFSGQRQATNFLAAHGVDVDEPLVAEPAPSLGVATGVAWLAPPGALATPTGLVAAPSTAPTLAGSPTLTTGTPTRGGSPARPGGLLGGDVPSVVRYVMNSGLPLHAQPSFASATEMMLQRGDRVFVLSTIPVPAQGNVFVEVQVADRAPYPVGWMPLHWLVVSPVANAPVTVDFEASYGLIANVAREFIANAFYADCDRYPRYAQEDVIASIPELENPASIPYAQRYECGELPIGTVQSSSRKLLTNFSFTTPGKEYEIAGVKVIDIDELDFTVPVKMYRLPWQTRGTYEMKDLSTGWGAQFDENADVVEHGHYQKFLGMLREDLVRVHDSDVWFNVSWTAPPGVAPVANASAYFNLCWALPGGRLEGDYTPLDIHIGGVGGESHVTGVHWGIVEYAPFRVCATAALRATPDTSNLGGLTTGHASPLQVQLVKASLRDLSVTYTQPLELYGSFAGVHAAAIGFLLEWITAVGQDEGLMGVLFNAFVRERVEGMLSQQLYDLTSRLALAIPDPENAIRTTCDRLMPASYQVPTSPFYPLYQHCRQAAGSADVTLFSNAIEHLQSCHDPVTYARANDGSAWSSGTDDHDVYYAPPDGDPIGIDRPYWVRSCEVEATVDMTVMSGYEELLECAAGVFDEGVNFRKTQAWIRNKAQQRCLTPAVGLMCDLYGEGEDLKEMWSEMLGGEVPDLAGYTDFCDWYDSLTAPDLPDYAIE